ncbi:hypothetical protein KCV06_g187, partial [Aureobasidium melanogenum]
LSDGCIPDSFSLSCFIASSSERVNLPLQCLGVCLSLIFGLLGCSLLLEQCLVPLSERGVRTLKSLDLAIAVCEDPFLLVLCLNRGLLLLSDSSILGFFLAQSLFECRDLIPKCNDLQKRSRETARVFSWSFPNLSKLENMLAQQPCQPPVHVLSAVAGGLLVVLILQAFVVIPETIVLGLKALGLGLEVLYSGIMVCLELLDLCLMCLFEALNLVVLGFDVRGSGINLCLQSVDLGPVVLSDGFAFVSELTNLGLAISESMAILSSLILERRNIVFVLLDGFVAVRDAGLANVQPYSDNFVRLRAAWRRVIVISTRASARRRGPRSMQIGDRPKIEEETDERSGSLTDSFGDGVAANRAEDMGESLTIGALEKWNDIGDGAQDE